MHSILIVDDDFQLRNLLKEALGQFNYSVLTAGDGSRALKILNEVKIDFMIIDIIMPEKDGLEIIPEIRKKFPDIKIMAYSGGMEGLNPFC